MLPQHAVLNCYRLAFRWGGRATREEFWWVFMYAWVLVIGTGILLGGVQEDTPAALPVMQWACGIFLLAHIIPFFGTLVRRCRDGGESPLLLLTLLVPLLNIVFFFLITLKPSRSFYSGVERVDP